MYEEIIAEYRAAAAACSRWAESEEINEATSLRWRKLADEWTRSADEMFQPTGN